jgi:hypothetical protein
VRPWCSPDPNNGAEGYWIGSLYLDSAALASYHAWERADADRVKLRVRRYSGDGPAWLEIKRKVNQIIHKLRVPVPRERVEDAIQGRWTDPAWGPREREIAGAFQALQWRLGAAPLVWIGYHRAAFVSQVDRYARVTFDRQIRACAAAGWSMEPPEANWVALDGADALEDGVSSLALLELKCETQVPTWISALIRSEGLIQSGFSKYSRGIEAVGLARSQAPQTWRPFR